MPDYKTGKLDDNGKDVYQDIAYPVTRQSRRELYDEIVKEFNAVMKQEGKQAGEGIDGGVCIIFYVMPDFLFF